MRRVLRAKIDDAHYHLGCILERVDYGERGVRVQFHGGRIEHADVLVGGDGKDQIAQMHREARDSLPLALLDGSRCRISWPHIDDDDQ
jgi:hypothetical protein